jgi:hypothetical protein
MSSQNEMMPGKGQGHFLKNLRPLTRKWFTLYLQDDTLASPRQIFCLSPVHKHFCYKQLLVLCLPGA